MVESTKRIGAFFLAGMMASVASIGVAEMPSWVKPGETKEASMGWRDSLAEGWKDAKSTGLPMVIFITSENCIYCKAMEKKTWCSEQVREQIGGRFIPVRLIAGRNVKSLSKVSVDVYPTTLLATPEGDVVAHRKGFQPPERIRALLGHLPKGRLSTH